MYNEPQKLLYIEDYLKSSKVKDKETRRNSMGNFFNRIEDVEKPLDKDFAMFNYEEVKMALSMICRRSVRYQKSVLSELRSYVEWCIDHHFALDCENRLIGIAPSDIDMVASYRINMFKEESEFNLALDTVLMPMKEDTSHNLLRAILHLLFNGISYNEVFCLRSNQVELEERIIHLESRDVKISSMCRDVLKYVMNMYEFFSAPKFDADNIDTSDDLAIGFDNMADGARKGVKKYRIVKNGYAIENSKMDRSSMPSNYIPVISNAFTAIKKAKGDIVSTTTGDIITSGLFCRIYEKESQGEKADFQEYFAMAKQDVKNEYGMSASLRDAELQYAGWKTAFGLGASD